MPEYPMQTTRTSCLNVEVPGVIERAVDLLHRGGLVCFPTDTVYGIGAHAFQPQAIERLFAIKRRPVHLPIPLLLADVASLEVVCADIPPIAWQLAARFWPGGLSLVLRRLAQVPDLVTAGGATVAVRVPDHAWVRQLCGRLGAPLAATSANLHGQPPPVTAGDVADAFEGQVPLIVDGGVCRGGVASTVLDLTVTPPAILRPGPIGVQQLMEIGGLEFD